MKKVLKRKTKAPGFLIAKRILTEKNRSVIEHRNLFAIGEYSSSEKEER